MNWKISWWAESSGLGVESLPWWAILLIAGGLLVVAVFIPWKKIFGHFDQRKAKKEEHLGLESKSPSKKMPEKNPKNTPYWGVYNWFGKKQALRTTKLVYVEEQEDACPLCRPFENQVLSLEDFGQNITTMGEAISQGYHHLGCHHLDVDYFHGVTLVPRQNYWSVEHKQTRYYLRLKQYELEQTLRDLKYQLENKNLKPTAEEKLRAEIQETETELVTFIQTNDLVRNQERENPAISDWKKFS